MNERIANAIKEAINIQKAKGITFNNKVRAWWEIGENGELKYCGDNKEEDHYAKGEEVHVPVALPERTFLTL